MPLLVLLILLALCGSPARAQDDPQPAAAESAQGQAAPVAEDETPGELPRRRWAEGRGWDWQANNRGVLSLLRGDFMRRLKEDEGPLAPGEEQQLLEFARVEMPDLFRALDADRARAPEVFRKRFTGIAARLRFFRRAIQLDAELGRALIEHADRQFRKERLRRALREVPAEADAQQVEAQLREALAEVTRSEVRILRMQADVLERSRAQIVAERIFAMRSEQFELAAAPPRIRESIEELRQAHADLAAAADEAARAAAQQRVDRIEHVVGVAVERRIDMEIAARRRRAERIEQNAPELVDEQMARMQKEIQEGGPPDGGRFDRGPARERRVRPAQPPGGADAPE